MDPLVCHCSNLKIISFQNNISVWGLPIWACVLIIALLLFLSMLFSACENAYSLCNKYHFHSLKEKGKLIGKAVSKLIDKFDNTLVTVLIGNNAVATLMSALCSMLFNQICQAYGLGSGVEVLLSTVLVGFLCYIIGDTIPKVISKALPNQIAIVMAYPILFLYYLIYPIVLIYRLMLKGFHKAFKIKEESVLSKQDVLEQIDEAINDETIIEDEEEKEKLFENDEKEIIDNVMTFDQVTISNSITPFNKVFCLDINGLTAKKVNKVLTEVSYNRIPIYDETKDNIIGILVTKIYLKEYIKDPHLSIPSILEHPVFCYNTDFMDDVFEKMNQAHCHLAIVKNKDNKIIGIITMEDILEEIVDDIDEVNTQSLVNE